MIGERLRLGSFVLTTAMITVVILQIAQVGCTTHRGQAAPLGTSNPEVSPTTLEANGVGIGATESGDPEAGKLVFAASCARCHGASGTEGGIGPSLVGERDRKDTAFLIAWIKNPLPPMPKLYPKHLSEKDVADVAAYVESL